MASVRFEYWEVLQAAHQSLFTQYMRNMAMQLPDDGTSEKLVAVRLELNRVCSE